MAKFDYQLTLTILRAQGLIAADSNGFSDPFVSIILDNQKRKTTIIKRTLNPEWNETFKIDLKTVITHLEFRVWDYDKLTNDPLGKTFLHLNDLVIGKKIKKELPLMAGGTGSLFVEVFVPSPDPSDQSSEYAKGVEHLRKCSGGNGGVVNEEEEEKDERVVQKQKERMEEEEMKQSRKIFALFLKFEEAFEELKKTIEEGKPFDAVLEETTLAKDKLHFQEASFCYCHGNVGPLVTDLKHEFKRLKAAKDPLLVLQEIVPLFSALKEEVVVATQ